jgi:elongation factor Tu
MNKVDLVDDPEILELVEMEIRELSRSMTSTATIFRSSQGSATVRSTTPTAEIGRDAVLKLMAAVDEFIPQPARPLDKPFLMPIEDVFSISGRGTVVTGRVETGVDQRGRRSRNRRPEGHQEDGRAPASKCSASCLIAVKPATISVRCCAAPSVKTWNVVRFWPSPARSRRTPTSQSEVYVLSKDEGGRHTPFFANYRPQFYFRTTDVTGEVVLPEGTEMVMPGDNVQLTVKLIAPIAMDQGLRFSIREGGRTVGAGVVASITEVI